MSHSPCRQGQRPVDVDPLQRERGKRFPWNRADRESSPKIRDHETAIDKSVPHGHPTGRRLGVSPSSRLGTLLAGSAG